MACDLEETCQHGDLPINDLPVGFPPALGQDDSVGDFSGLEVRPAAFRGGTKDAVDVLSDCVMMRIDGASEERRWHAGCKDNELEVKGCAALSK